ncbi:MAG: hypothetical protein V1861_02895 [Candidatus Micrarchaeota archaeon]
MSARDMEKVNLFISEFVSLLNSRGHLCSSNLLPDCIMILENECGRQLGFNGR